MNLENCLSVLKSWQKKRNSSVNVEIPNENQQLNSNFMATVSPQQQNTYQNVCYQSFSSPILTNHHQSLHKVVGEQTFEVLN